MSFLVEFVLTPARFFTPLRIIMSLYRDTTMYENKGSLEHLL